MIRQLRQKMVAAAMASLFVVLTVILCAIHIVNYQAIVTSSDDVLDLLGANRGMFPRPGPEGFSPEMPYEARYFSVLLDSQGETIMVDTGRIAAVDQQTAENFARQVWQGGNQRGFLGEYRYLRVQEGRDWRIIFLDCGRNLATFRGFLITSLWVSAGGLLAVFVLVVVVSRRLVKPVVESYEKQRQFITDAGHELKTPLTIMGADVDLLEMEVGEGEWTRDLRAQVHKMTRLTQDLIYLSRMEEATPSAQHMEMIFSDVVEEVVQPFRGPALAKEQRLSVEITPMLTIQGEEGAIRQLVSIFMDNAMKYTPCGGEIQVRVGRQGRYVRLVVGNTVERPIPPQQLARFFDRFYRGDGARSGGGFGIGLSVAAAIVSSHRGKIEAVSTNPQWLEMVVLLPVGK